MDSTTIENRMRLYFNPMYIKEWAFIFIDEKISGPGYGRLLDNFICEFIFENERVGTAIGNKIVVSKNGVSCQFDVPKWANDLLEDPMLPLYPIGQDVIEAIDRLEF